MQSFVDKYSNKSSAVAEMGDRGHNRHGPKKRGRCCAPFAGELGPRLTQCGLGRGLLPCQVASSSIQRFGHNAHEPKTGGCAPFRGAAATPSNTTWPGPRFTSEPSGILIHPSVCAIHLDPSISLWPFWGELGAHSL